MNQIKRHCVAVMAGAALWVVCGASHGLGLGRANSHAILGDDLSLTVPVRLEAGERLDDECLAADVFFGDDKVAPERVRAKLQTDAKGATEIRVTTLTPINEPVVTVYVVAGCQSRITRKIVALADPPGMQMASTVGESTLSTPDASRALVSAPRNGDSGPLTKAVPSARAAKSNPSSSSAPRWSAGADDAAPVRQSLSLAAQARITDPAQASDAARSRSPALANANRARPAPLAEAGRLELDPVATDALVEPHLKMGTSLSTDGDPEAATPEVLARRASAAAYWRALQSTPEQMARDHARVAELEQRLAELQGQMQALSGGAAASGSGLSAPAAVAAASLPASSGSEVQRSRTTALVGGGVALLIGLAYVYWRGRKSAPRARTAWWQAAGDDDDSVSLRVADAADTDSQVMRDVESTTVEFVHVPEKLMPASTQALSPVMAPFAERALPSSRTQGAQYSSMFASLTPPIDEPSRAVTVEELIDLEQQADFFVVLGQDDAAIELLEGYAHHMQVGSPLPMLKLLEIYHRLGRRDDYERTRQAFDARYNAHAPAWDDDMQQGHTLVNYPDVVARLQALWPEPSQAMVVLEKSLTRPTEGGDTFDLPAYRELLMLYAVARDLAEPSTAGGQRVDVLLPLPSDEVDQGGEIGPLSLSDVSPLMATRPLPAQGRAATGLSAELQVDLDVDLPLDVSQPVVDVSTSR
jgi:pilus assembly protein FimV